MYVHEIAVLKAEGFQLKKNFRLSLKYISPFQGSSVFATLTQKTAGEF